MEVAGEILGLIGPNGAGKTTLFNLITGFHSPSKGRIFFSDRDITSTAPHDRCWMGIARTFQLVRPFPHLTVQENVAVGRVYGRDSVRRRAQAEAEANQYLERVGLGGRSAEKARNLTLVDETPRLAQALHRVKTAPGWLPAGTIRQMLASWN
jgi:branched-chain amino acid transport system ATP-binding protein